MSKEQTAPTSFAPGWIEALDGRTAIAQDVRKRYVALTNDLGGEESLSYQKRSLVERALWLEVHLRGLERTLAETGELDSGRWVNAVNSLVGLYKSLGLDRQSRPVGMAEVLKGTSK